MYHVKHNLDAWICLLDAQIQQILKIIMVIIDMFRYSCLKCLKLRVHDVSAVPHDNYPTYAEKFFIYYIPGN